MIGARLGVDVLATPELVGVTLERGVGERDVVPLAEVGDPSLGRVLLLALAVVLRQLPESVDGHQIVASQLGALLASSHGRDADLGAVQRDDLLGAAVGRDGAEDGQVAVRNPLAASVDGASSEDIVTSDGNNLAERVPIASLDVVALFGGAIVDRPHLHEVIGVVSPRKIVSGQPSLDILLPIPVGNRPQAIDDLADGANHEGLSGLLPAARIDVPRSVHIETSGGGGLVEFLDDVGLRRVIGIHGSEPYSSSSSVSNSIGVIMPSSIWRLAIATMPRASHDISSESEKVSTSRAPPPLMYSTLAMKWVTIGSLIISARADFRSSTLLMAVVYPRYMHVLAYIVSFDERINSGLTRGFTIFRK